MKNTVCFSWAGLHYSLEQGFKVLLVSVRVTLEFILYRHEMGNGFLLLLQGKQARLPLVFYNFQLHVDLFFIWASRDQ